MNYHKKKKKKRREPQRTKKTFDMNVHGKEKSPILILSEESYKQFNKIYKVLNNGRGGV